MARIATKIGDIFSVGIGNGKKRYFQLIEFDSTQLNSDVIRAFETEYIVSDKPDIRTILYSKVTFYAHCVTKLGLKIETWEKYGASSDIGSTEGVFFRSSPDYGSQPGVRFRSEKWFVWEIGKDQVRVNRDDYRLNESYIGLVFTPNDIVGLLRGERLPAFYPDFE